MCGVKKSAHGNYPMAKRKNSQLELSPDGRGQNRNFSAVNWVFHRTLQRKSSICRALYYLECGKVAYVGFSTTSNTGKVAYVGFSTAWNYGKVAYIGFSAASNSGKVAYVGFSIVPSGG